MQRHWIDYVTGFGAAVAALAATWQALISKNAAKVQTRAYVVVKANDHLIRSDSLIRYEIGNLGQTPANITNVSFVLSAERSNVFPTKTRNDPIVLGGTGSVAPIIVISREKPWTEWLETYKNTATAKIDITYIDVFGDTHHAKSCSRVTTGEPNQFLSWPCNKPAEMD